MLRLLALLVALVALAVPSPARPDAADIAAAARGVVRVVIMGTDGERVFPVSHGTGFAISSTRIVTNAHVIREAMQDDTLRIAIVPPDGDGADYGRIVSASAGKDLAIIELTGSLRLPALTVAGTGAAHAQDSRPNAVAGGAIHGGIAGAHEIGVQRMRTAAAGAAFHRGLRRRQGLAQHLAAEDVLGADVAALAAEQVVLEALEAEQVDQLGGDG